MNGDADGREDCLRLLERHGAAPRKLQQGRSVEARQHDAEAPLQVHLVEHLRRWGAGGEGGVGYSRLVSADPPRDANLKQFQDLTGRPGVDVSKGAFADLLTEGLCIARPPSRRANTAGALRFSSRCGRRE